VNIDHHKKTGSPFGQNAGTSGFLNIYLTHNKIQTILIARWQVMRSQFGTYGFLGL
jgi:hypothetical protein